MHFSLPLKRSGSCYNIKRWQNKIQSLSSRLGTRTVGTLTDDRGSVPGRNSFHLPPALLSDAYGLLSAAARQGLSTVEDLPLHPASFVTCLNPLFTQRLMFKWTSELLPSWKCNKLPQLVLRPQPVCYKGTVLAFILKTSPFTKTIGISVQYGLI